MKHRISKLGILFLSMLIGSSAFAQFKFSIQKIDMPQPFSRAFIRNVVRDRFGFIYFTTNQGIWRYDGTDVQAFSIPGVKLPSAPLVSHLSCYQHFILLRFNNDQDLLFCYDSDRRKLHKFRIKGLSKFAEDSHSGRLMLFTTNGQAYSLDKNARLQKSFRLQSDNPSTNFKEPDVYFFDASGRLFLLFRTSLAEAIKGTIKSGKEQGSPPMVQQEGSMPYNMATTFIINAFETSRYLVVRYSHGYAIYDKSTLEKLFDYHNDDEFVYTFPEKDTIMVVFRGLNKGFKPPTSKYFKVYKGIDIYSSINRIWPCKALGSEYIAIADNHLYLITPDKTPKKDTNVANDAMKFFHNKSIRGIYKDGSNYYVGTYNDFCIFNSHTATSIPIIVYAIQKSGNNQLMIGVEGGDGLATLNMQNNIVDFLPNPDHINIGITKLVNYNNGFIAGMRSSLYVVSKNGQGQWIHRNWLTDKRLGIIKDIAIIKGKVWVAGEGGLFRLDGNNFIRLALNALSDIPVYAILQVKDGILLATLGQGIVKIDYAGKLLWKVTFTDGLAGEFAYSLLEVDGLLFSGTNGGLSVLDLKSMQVLPNPDDSQYEELYSQEFNHSAIYYDKQQRQVLMGGLQGLVFLDVDYYKALRGNNTEKLVLSYVKKSSNSITAPQIDLFAQANNNINIMPEENLAALKFAGSFKQKDLLFRIKEISESWRKSKLFNEISLYALPPGIYTLEARFPSNTDPRYWLVKTITIKPTFYQTWIFKAMILIVISLFICHLWFSRLKKLRHEMEIRTNIASDLHDEIGSTLTRISLSSELMHTKQEADQDVIQKISNESKNAIASISDIIWSVDARNDNREDLIFRMQEHVHFMLSDNADVIFETTGLEKTRTLPQLLRQNIYLIFKEAINNIVRHNQRPRVWISLNNQPMGMKITIKNTIDKKQGITHSGQGLKNMKMRADRIKASLSIINSEKYFVVTIKTKRW